MADALKNLGQSLPAAGTLTALYTVPGSTSAVMNLFTACNESSATARFRLSVAVAGAADAISQYVYFDQQVAGRSTFVASLGIPLATTDVVRVQSDSGSIAFHAYGVEVT